MSTVYIVSENIAQNSNFSIKLQKYALRENLPKNNGKSNTKEIIKRNFNEERDN